MTMLAALVSADWGDHMDGWGAGPWIVMVVGMVFFWAFVVVGVVWLVRARPWTAATGGDSAMDLLDRRFAAGEISADEYRERRAVLRGGDSG
jgi:putative membrane protein